MVDDRSCCVAAPVIDDDHLPRDLNPPARFSDGLQCASQ
jgi:hypothetical protein